MYSAFPTVTKSVKGMGTEVCVLFGNIAELSAVTVSVAGMVSALSSGMCTKNLPVPSPARGLEGIPSPETVREARPADVAKRFIWPGLSGAELLL